MSNALASAVKNAGKMGTGAKIGIALFVIVFLVGIGLLIAYAVNPDIFNMKKEGDECEGDDDRGTYEIDEDGKCTLISCEAGWEVSGDKCVKSVVSGEICSGTDVNAIYKTNVSGVCKFDECKTGFELDDTDKCVTSPTNIVGPTGTTSPTNIVGPTGTTSPTNIVGPTGTTSPTDTTMVAPSIPKSSTHPSDPDSVPSHGWIVAPNGNMIWPAGSTIGQYPRWNDPRTVWNFKYDTSSNKYWLIKDGNMHWTSEFMFRTYPFWYDPKTLWDIIPSDDNDGKYWLVAPSGSMIYLARDDSGTMHEHPYWRDPTTLWTIIPT